MCIAGYFLKFSFKIQIGGGGAARATHHNIISFLVILARKVSLLGLLTELSDRIFQSIILRGKNDNL